MTAARKLRDTCSTGTDCWIAPFGLAAMNAVVGGSTQRSETITSAWTTRPTASTFAIRRASSRTVAVVPVPVGDVPRRARRDRGRAVVVPGPVVRGPVGARGPAGPATADGGPAI